MSMGLAERIAGGSDNVAIWQVPKAHHIQGLAVATEEWESRVIGFLDQALGP